MSENLYEMFNVPIVQDLIAKEEVPRSILDNLRKGFGQRPYQLEAFRRYLYFDRHSFSGKQSQPYHLLFNMATGSGKTLIMAGLILYLFEQGYRNFLFFVNTNNIINKTRDNFLNPEAAKYLFAPKITVDGREVRIKEVQTFDEADDQNINIKFTTIQKLHSDLNEAKENSVTYEDFEGTKLVMLADEAHHLNATTKTKTKEKTQRMFEELPEDELPDEESWEITVKRLLHQNSENLLLGFSATLDYESQLMAEKYKSRVIYKYDLREFREDRYSKEINLLRSQYDKQDRILQALILNQYRQELAAEHGINLKPVILFKAKRTIKESQANKEEFHQLIENLSARELHKIKRTSQISIVQRAFAFFEEHGIDDAELARRIATNFREENCISANNDKEAAANQIKLNTLEDSNNPIRAVFAVQKLNEGWDVLNLFDIVRLYDDRDGKHGKPGKTTLSEAQLIGRGARYFPFKLQDDQDLYRRKFDDDKPNDLRMLEELYYHTREDSRYIAELKTALVETGIYEDPDNLETKQLLLKEDFKKSTFYKTGRVFLNSRQPRDYSKVASFADLGAKKRDPHCRLSSGGGRVSSAFFAMEAPKEVSETMAQKRVLLKDIPTNVISYALSANPFFHFDSLLQCFPHLPSIKQFVSDDNYLGDMGIVFLAPKDRLARLDNADYLQGMEELLQQIEAEIKGNLTVYEGTEFIDKLFHKVFTDKEIHVPKRSERADGQEGFLHDKEWYAYNANYGTSEEKDFVHMFDVMVDELQQKYTNVYLIRNERMLKIFTPQGRAFEPDFLLYCKEKNGRELTFQMFIEPKGAHLMEHDKWKEEFLRDIRNDEKTITINDQTYRITGVPFYNNKDENAFRKSMQEALALEDR